MSMHVAVIYGALSPYHVVRMAAAERFMKRYSWKVTTIERVGYQAEYSSFGSDESPGINLKRAYEICHPSPTDRESKLQLWRLLSDLRPDCVVFGRSSPVYYSVLEWCVDQEIPAVLLSDSTVFDYKRYFWKEWIKSQITQLFSAGFVAGTRQREYLLSLGMAPEKIVTGYDVVDNAYFSTGADRARANASDCRMSLGLPERYFLVSSRFVEKKNLFRLIEAYGEYLKREGTSGWSLVILGDGSLRLRIEQKIKSLGLTNHVILPGFIHYGVLPDYYGLASVFILASTSEQWGLVVNEAMASGLPVLVSERCGCAPDLVQKGVNGFTFNPFDVQELATQMHQITSDDFDEMELGQASRKIINQWTPEIFATSLLKVIRCAIDGPHIKANIKRKVLLRAFGPK